MEVKNRDTYERTLREKIIERFRELRESILLNPLAVDWIAFRDRLAADLQRESETLFLLIAILLIAWFESEAPPAAKGEDSQPNQPNPRPLQPTDLIPIAKEFAKKRASETAANVAKSVKQAINELQAIANEVQQLQDIADRLKTTLDKQLSDHRADVIAVTEITHTISVADDSTARYIEQRRPVYLPPIWFTQEDEKVCPICGPLHGKGPVAWAHMFPTGPPAHPVCRCWKDRKIVPLVTRGTGRKKTPTTA